MAILALPAMYELPQIRPYPINNVISGLVFAKIVL